jgi:hypothetical protein
MKQVAIRAYAEDGGRHVPPKRRLVFKGLHDVIGEKIDLFITTDVITSYPSSYFFIYSSISLILCPSLQKSLANRAHNTIAYE